MKDPRFIVEPTLIPHVALETAMDRVRQCHSCSLKSPEPICAKLVGDSRNGKSRVQEEAERLLPPKLTTAGAVVPILRVAAPARPTAEGVARVLLQALSESKWESGTEVHRTGRLKAQLRERQTLTILLDEFQCLN